MEDPKHVEIIEKQLKPHPKQQASFLSHFFFCWELPILLKGWKKKLGEDYIYVPLEDYKSSRLGDELEKNWLQEECLEKKPSLTRALVKLFGLEFVLYGLMFLPLDVIYVIGHPHFLQKLLNYFTVNNVETTRQEAYICAGILSILYIIRVLSYHCFSMACSVVGMKVRIACSSLLYRRSLKLSKTSLDDVTSGKIINLLSNDVIRFEQVFQYLHFVWIGPLELVIGTYYIDVAFGHEATAGVVVIFLTLFFQIYVSNRLVSIRAQVAVETDHRIRLMNDVICGIQAIKMYTWEKPYLKLVDFVRKLEMKLIGNAHNVRLFNNVLKIHMSKVCIFLCILAAALTDVTLTSQFVFALTSIYESFKLSMVIMLPLGVIMFSEVVTTVKRIQDFLLNDYDPCSTFGKSITSVYPKILKNNQKEFRKKSPGMVLTDIKAKWNSSLQDCALDNVSLNVIAGELVGIIGPPGSGKSTLLHVILQEIPIIRGCCQIEGTISYASQEPWIFPSSVKQNIIFGQDFDLQKYEEVIRICALRRDLTLFPHGDQTLVGERGVMLSGGQKARINLARAIYRDADIYLLDDPLSAVDVHVGRHIFDECILDYLKNKCVILVTHQVHYLDRATKIYRLESGRVTKYGSFENVIDPKDKNPDNVEHVPLENISEVSLDKNELQFETKEHRTSGNTALIHYKNYFKAAGSWYFSATILALYLLSQIFVNLCDIFVTFWVNVNQGAVDISSSYSDLLTDCNLLYALTALTIATVLVIHVTAFAFTKFCISSSKNLHKHMIYRILQAPMSFFNHHSSGRILNRFAKDMGCIDEVLPMHLMNGISVAFAMAAILIFVMAINYWMILPTIVLVVLTFLLAVGFQPTNRNIKRMEGITKSSVFAHVSASLQGLTTIRAANIESKLIKEFDHYQDIHSSAFYIFIAAFSAFGFWGDFLTAIHAILVTYGFFLLESSIPVGNVGLSLTQSGLIMLMVQYAMKTWGDLDALMTSVERVVEYTTLDTEVDDGPDTPPDVWPTAGNVVFNKVSLKYSPNDPPVLKNISFVIKPGEKIGIVGRTGAGKSSLTSVLFRLFDFEGSVIIDGVDTKSISLEKLRSKISIIPQEPVLFLGTLRKNIDLFDEFDDSQIWSALEELKLKQLIQNIPFGLESAVSERGSNLSVGQRQLLCLVRAMLKNNRVIVLDEATANVDLETDNLIQSTIRKKFKDCTVLTIAHRLHTVMDSDKILVMDGGVVVEFDDPDRLLKNPHGFFYSYVNNCGVQSD